MAMLTRFLLLNASRGSRAISLSSRLASSVSITDNGKILKLICDDHQQDEAAADLRYHSIWLRHNCRCPSCFSPSTDQTIVPVPLLTNDLKLISTEIKGNDVHFTVSASSTNHAHSGHCPIDWLKEAAYSGNAIDKQRSEAEPVLTTTLPTCDFTDIMTTDKGLYRWLKQINVYGVSLIQNMPAIPGQLEQMIEKRIGKIHTTIYGRTFDVVASETPINQAYTSDALQLHMDLVFYENMPGLQLLHCITNDVVEGGDSILLDAYPVVLEMRDKYPKQFDVLTKVPFTSERVHYKRDVPVDYKYSTPIIRLNNDGHIIAINWGPQIQSPLMINEHEVEDFYEAFTLLHSMFDRSDKKIYYKFQPGEAVTFNNRRYLHGRTAFTQNRGKRHLEGLYVLMDDYKSLFQVMAKKLKTGDKTKHLLNNSWRP